jgi:hypothetical protein
LYFNLGLIVGDNLALNSILGFSKCFRGNFHCRFCKLSREKCYKATKEDVNSLRTKETHEADLLLPFSDSGLKKDSISNSIPAFHVVKNFSVDLMHDILEGVAKYDLAESLLLF